MEKKYDFLEGEAAPIREDRLRACNAFGGSCSELSKGAKKGCLNNTKRTFSQTQGCQLVLSSAIINTLRNVVVVIHAPIGCGGGNIASAGISRAFQRLRDPKAKGLIWINTNLEEADTIGGGDKKLRAAILHAENEFKPEAIIVVNSCVPAIIGDDIDAVANELRDVVSARIVPVHCAGFRTKIMATAYDSVYHGILKNLISGYHSEEKDETAIEEYLEKAKKNKIVNVLNVSSMSISDEVELKKILSKLGIETRIYPCYSSANDFDKVTEAGLNISICATHDDYFVGHLKERYNIPYVLNTIPVGIKNTNKWIRDIAQFFGIEEEAEKLIKEETDELEKVLEPYKKELKGKTVFLAGGEIRVIATGELFQHLGMEVIGMKGYHYDEFGENILDSLENNENIVFNIATGQPFEQANLLERLRPDIYIGHTGGNSWAAKHGVPIFPLFAQTINYMGYSGVFEITKRVARVLKNRSFNRNIAKFTKLPYRKEWLAKDPFAYIDQSSVEV